MVATAQPQARQISDVVERALAGNAPTPDDAYRAINASATELASLMAAASELRDRGHGRTVTYSRKVFIPLTNLCRQKCGYCTFARGPRDPIAHTMSPDEVLAVARAGARQGCKEALFSLGERPEEVYDVVRDDLARYGHATTSSYLREMCELVLRETGLQPHVNQGVMEPGEIASLREVSASMGMMLETVSLRLHEKGMAHWNCPGKIPEERLRTMRHAGEQKVAWTTGILIGIGETREERVDSLFAIRELHERYGHIQEVIVQNFRVKEDIAMRHRDEPSVFEMLRTIAVARLILGPQMNIQAPPNLTPDAHGMYLLAGINDWGGISPVTKDHINPERPWPNLLDLKDTCADAGFELRERFGLYPEYVRGEAPCGGFVPDAIRPVIGRLADEDGLVKREEERW
ncbi:MAG TPA: 7,8-didemethyl-8-hydroxy-5-deazariboflavin synthase CofG [Dehalococcoidia bacterium]|nr:7,8-didemethyl-8-hydroxy-5-deazariboflavin synthase CofG [Dehalococcoidia bacterium]